MPSEKTHHARTADRSLVGLLLFLLLLFVVPSPALATDWLATNGNNIIDAKGQRWHGRGVNLPDMGSNQQCYGNFDPTEMIRRGQVAVGWGANFLRIPLDSTAQIGQSPNSLITENPNYLAGLKNFVDALSANQELYIMLTPWSDPTIPRDPNWLPTAGTDAVWQKLVDVFYSYPNVIFGVANEPHDVADPNIIRQAMEHGVSVIRNREAMYGSYRHIVSVQGNSYSSDLSLYNTFPIVAFGGVNVVYEAHVYSNSSQQSWVNRWLNLSAKLPVIIGEYGPAAASSTTGDYLCGQSKDSGSRMALTPDISSFLQTVRTYEIPYLAWAFHEWDPPNMLSGPSSQPQSSDPNQRCVQSGCDANMSISLTSWGTAVYNDLQQDWSNHGDFFINNIVQTTTSN